ncbi:MAG: hypothetical protein QGH60_19215 [Phycisphaerae bacterium]|jgi:hypothetical protein|nr:hypothetical protein [Phycisphaerae bacterium]
MPSVHNPQNVSIGATELSDVLSIEWYERRDEIVSPPGDDEIYHRRVGYGSAVLHGRLTFTDPAQAAAAAGCFGTLSATLKGVGGGPDRTLTITNARTGGSDNLTGHNRAATCGVPFLAASGDGATGPVTLT